jgi:hypothetical protein
MQAKVHQYLLGVLLIGRGSRLCETLDPSVRADWVPLGLPEAPPLPTAWEMSSGIAVPPELGGLTGDDGKFEERNAGFLPVGLAPGRPIFNDST